MGIRTALSDDDTRIVGLFCYPFGVNMALGDIKLTFELVNEKGWSCESVRLSIFLKMILP